jgi:hypothetical protein
MQAYPTNTLYTSILDDFGNITQGTMDRECMAVGSLLVVYSVPWGMQYQALPTTTTVLYLGTYTPYILDTPTIHPSITSNYSREVLPV